MGILLNYAGILQQDAGDSLLVGHYGDYVDGGTLRTSIPNTELSQWDDLSGFDNHLTAEVAGQFCEYRSGIGGILMTSSNPSSYSRFVRDGALISGSQERTIIMVMYRNVAQNGYFFSQGSNNTTGATDNFINSTHNLNFGSNSLPTITAGVKFLLVLKLTGTTSGDWSYRKNGADISHTPTNPSTIMNTDSGGKTAVGDVWSGSAWLGPNAGIHAMELMFYQGALSLSEIQTLESSLNTKYSIY